ncbi:MAG TPA: LytR C-terminal domain-containing protein, partial [Candidatus Methanoperedens sp.]|nr:LytR C-terminal domain-containing protein [Candidatus Methanoperedens sp.]
LVSPITLDFPPSIVQDIDIIDLESFNLLLSSFVEQSKISPNDILLVVSPDIYYEKSIPLSGDTAARQSQIDLFLQTVPFKNLIYKDYSLGSQPRLITLNKNFYEPIAKFFENSAFNIVAIMPLFVLNHFQLNLSTFLPKEVKDIFQKYKLMEPYSFMNTEDIDKIVTTEVHRPKEEITKTTIVLIVIFCLLFVVLLVYIFVVPRLIKPPTPSKLSTPSLLSPSPTSAVSDILPIPSPVYIATDKLRIKIINSSGVTNQAAKIKSSLTSLGYKEIQTLSASRVTASKNQINFSSAVSPESRQVIMNAVEGIAGPSGDIESESLPDVDVLITTTYKQNN